MEGRRVAWGKADRAMAGEHAVVRLGPGGDFAVDYHEAEGGGGARGGSGWARWLGLRRAEPPVGRRDRAEGARWPRGHLGTQFGARLGALAALDEQGRRCAGLALAALSLGPGVGSTLACEALAAAAGGQLWGEHTGGAWFAGER